MTGVPLSGSSNSEPTHLLSGASAGASALGVGVAEVRPPRAAAPSVPAGGTRRRRPDGGAVYLGLSGGLLVASAVLGGAYVLFGDKPAAAAATTARSSEPVKAAPTDPTMAAILDREVEVKAGALGQTLRWRELGVVLDERELARTGAGDVAALASAGSLPLRLDREQAVAAIAGLKGKLDRAPIDARLDLEARTIADGMPGTGIDIFGSLGVLEAAARSASPSVELATVALPARVSKATLGIEEIGHVLGSFKTNFAVHDKDRNFNLKLAASKLNGHVIRPGETFSFNQVVGDRTEKEGYKIAHVITAGEMVDGLAGGTCQISTTLFGASFFAGLEVVNSLPHSRPSTYVTMGLDSTVVYPTVDLVLKNPYDFPVVIHFRVTRGEATVEILGKKRPYDKVVFEREVEEELPFTVQERPDDVLPIGYVSLDQPGFPGWKLIRYRKFFKGNKLVKTDKWKLFYRPVTEYVRVGTNVDPLAEVPTEEKQHHVIKPPTGTGRLTQ
jgi:vancomycin resistance protein YoaR